MKMNLLRRKKIFVAIFLLLIFFNFSIKKANAGVWGENIAAELMSELYQEIKEQFAGQILSSVKNQVGKILMKKLQGLTENYAIDNYNTFIKEASSGDAKEYMSNVYFSELNSNAESEHARNLNNQTEKAVMNESFSQGQDGPNLDLPPEDMFDQKKGGSLDNLVLIADNDLNNGQGNFLKASITAEEEKRVSEEAAKTEAVAGSGYETADGKPGSLYAAKAASAENYCRDSIVQSQNLIEIATLASECIKDNATSNAMASIQDQINNNISSISSQYSDVMGKVNSAEEDVESYQKYIYRGQQVLGIGSLGLLGSYTVPKFVSGN